MSVIFSCQRIGARSPITAFSEQNEGRHDDEMCPKAMNRRIPCLCPYSHHSTVFCVLYLLDQAPATNRSLLPRSYGTCRPDGRLTLPGRFIE